MRIHCMRARELLLKIMAVLAKVGMLRKQLPSVLVDPCLYNCCTMHQALAVLRSLCTEGCVRTTRSTWVVGGCWSSWPWLGPTCSLVRVMCASPGLFRKFFTIARTRETLRYLIYPSRVVVREIQLSVEIYVVEEIMANRSALAYTWGSKYPKQLLAYQTLIVREARRCRRLACVWYNVLSASSGQLCGGLVASEWNPLFHVILSPRPVEAPPAHSAWSPTMARRTVCWHQSTPPPGSQAWSCRQDERTCHRERVMSKLAAAGLGDQERRQESI